MVGQGSCSKSVSDEEAHRPRKAEPCTEINSGVTSSPARLFPFFIFRLDSFCYVSISFFL
ncbi:hypothetical protein [Priestia aryabhattai]|uniref:hypothetical protein n=1 Tax=Priestia aryabhattai TaxID=412384 RepID=UPI00147C71A8|nr:hypothetical protein [Priestia aryabhattai]MED4154107.1 hypothetical protein [Priestia aryabhattai]